MDIRKNTVPGENQMARTTDLSFLGNENGKLRILVVGNSITRHAPLAKIGWNNDWGMAASAPENDYVHRLYAKLEEAGFDVLMRIRQVSIWEISFAKDENVLSRYDEENEFDADIVIFRMGENVPGADKPLFKDGLRKLAKHICPSGKGIFVSCFWRNELIDETLKQIAEERGDLFIDGCLSDDESNMAIGKFEHTGVAMHPGDRGMEAIAELMFGAVKNL